MRFPAVAVVLMSLASQASWAAMEKTADAAEQKAVRPDAAIKAASPAANGQATQMTQAVSGNDAAEASDRPAVNITLRVRSRWAHFSVRINLG
ncbi:hypothetical protein G3574_23590 [Noviherbaspirillum sp. 17J57-3]|uniref:Uncharacterized protein n=2 Tax=Noviherbaspirillum galbum TaxID=2709383 RepID=A0A6B3SUC5_9BURK|nr:hypothetical protein [Noviherbaspirillum galbum]